MVQRLFGSRFRASLLRSSGVRGSFLVSVVVSASAVVAASACSAGGEGAANQGPAVAVDTPQVGPVTSGNQGPGPTGAQPVNPTPGPGGTTAPNPTSPNPDDDDLIIDDPGSLIGNGPSPDDSDGDLVQGEVCNSKGITFEKVVPSVLMLVDRSTSMFKSNLPTGEGGQTTCFDGSSPEFGTEPDRWTAMRAAVAALEPLAADVMFGMSTYTSFSTSVETCPEMPELATLLPGQTAFADIMAALPENTIACPEKKSETPTWEAIAAGAEALAQVQIEGPKYLLVITDGEPDSCVKFDPQCGQDAAIGAAQDAFAAGITTFVIGLGSDVGEKFLNDLAHAGQGLDVQPPETDSVWCIGQVLQGVDPAATFDTNNYRDTAMATYGADGLEYADRLFFAPADLAALQTQLTEVIAGVRTCDYEMDTAVVASKANKGAVRLTLADGTPLDLVYGDPNGWALSADNDYTVTLQGTACEKVLAEEVMALQIEFPCDVRVPRVR